MCDRYNVVVTEQQKFDYFVLDNLKNNSSYGDYLFRRYKELYDTEPIANLIKNIQDVLKEFNITDEEAIGIINRNLEVNSEDNECINIQSFFKFYEKKYTFHTLILDFIDYVFKHIDMILYEIEENVKNSYKLIDKADKGFLEVKDFVLLMNMLIPSLADNIYVFSDYFK